MLNQRGALLLAISCLLLAVGLGLATRKKPSAPAIVSYRLDVRRTTLKLYWKDDRTKRLGSLQGLKGWLDAKGQKLLFAMNAGMFNADYAPLGLFIQGQQTLVSLDTANGAGNFYLKPNGVFYTTTERVAHVCKTEDFPNANKSDVAYATQSGPMLVIDGAINPAFKPRSINVQIRNGVGILPDKRVLFALSTTGISLYDFASYFQQAGCQNALYLDGFVSRAYAPAENWTQLDGDFGAIIGVTEPQPRPLKPTPGR